MTNIATCMIYIYIFAIYFVLKLYTAIPQLSAERFHQQDWAMSGISTHWGRVTHICVRKLTIIGSDNGLSPGRRKAIIWTNAGILLIRSLGTNFNEMNRNSNIFIHENAFESVIWKIAAILSRPQCVKILASSQVIPSAISISDSFGADQSRILVGGT